MKTTGVPLALEEEEEEDMSEEERITGVKF
jgi:hypothetical protein